MTSRSGSIAVAAPESSRRSAATLSVKSERVDRRLSGRPRLSAEGHPVRRRELLAETLPLGPCAPVPPPAPGPGLGPVVERVRTAELGPAAFGAELEEVASVEPQEAAVGREPEQASLVLDDRVDATRDEVRERLEHCPVCERAALGAARGSARGRPRCRSRGRRRGRGGRRSPQGGRRSRRSGNSARRPPRPGPAPPTRIADRSRCSPEYQYQRSRSGWNWKRPRSPPNIQRPGRVAGDRGDPRLEVAGQDEGLERVTLSQLPEAVRGALPQGAVGAAMERVHRAAVGRRLELARRPGHPPRGSAPAASRPFVVPASRSVPSSASASTAPVSSWTLTHPPVSRRHSANFAPSLTAGPERAVVRLAGARRRRPVERPPRPSTVPAPSGRPEPSPGSERATSTPAPVPSHDA